MCKHDMPTSASAPQKLNISKSSAEMYLYAPLKKHYLQLTFLLQLLVHHLPK